MRLGFELTIEQTQKLSLTPELIQAIQILQLSTLELSEYVQKELLENPVLEQDESHPLENIDIRQKMVESYRDEQSFKQRENVPADDDYTYEQFAAVTYTLVDHLLSQLQFLELDKETRAICRFLIEGIDENGYLTMSEEEMTAELGVSAELVHQAIQVLQSLEPAGVGAANLGDCLRLQLAAKELLTETMEKIVQDHLQDLADNRIGQIAKALGLTPEEVQRCADLIKTLDPKPGRAFDSGDTVKYVVPDVFVEMVDGEPALTINETSSPQLMISSYYHKLASQAKADPELEKYLTGRYNAAVWLIKSIEQRKATIRHVADAIVTFQRDFFLKGEKYLKPMTLREIAQVVGVHESTVSRSINGKYLQCDQGVLELKSFFTSGVASGDGGVSSSSVKSRIREMIGSEDSKKPLSDQDMADRLGQEGIEVSRRTVAKYRESLGILSSSKRRRF